jgi:hypothetical protein
MPLSNAERQARWRARRKQERIEKQTASPKVVIAFDPPHLKPLDKLPINAVFKGQIINDKSKINYKNSLKLMFKDYWNTELSNNHIIFDVLDNKAVSYKDVAPDFNFLNNVDGRATIIKYRRHAINVLNIVRRIRGFSNYQKKLIPYRDWVSHNYEIQRQHIVLPPISFEYDDVMKVFNSIDDINEKIIYGLLMLAPPRRIGDYNKTVIINNKEDFDKIDKTENYYYDGKIYIYKSKVDNRSPADIAAQQPIYIIDVPPEVIALINPNFRYLIQKNLLVCRLFEKYHGYNYTNQNIRRLYASHKLKINYNTVKQVADSMGHNVEQNLRYALST